MADVTIRRSRPDDAGRLFDIWHDAVRATHDFLLPQDLEFYASLVREELLPSGDFWVAVDDKDWPLGWLQLVGSKVEALFVDPECHRRGIGRKLMDHARMPSPRLELEVSEQSLIGTAFYHSLGFKVVGRSPLDGAGRPYPLLHMELEP